MTTDDLSLDDDLRSAASLVRSVLSRVGANRPTFIVERPRYYHGFDTDKWELEFSDEPADDIRIPIRTDDPADGLIGAHFRLVAPRAEAVVATATHVQDYVLECTRGEPLPLCPGHRHPLAAAVVDGLARWVCPQDPDHHVEPILAGPVDG